MSPISCIYYANGICRSPDMDGYDFDCVPSTCFCMPKERLVNLTPHPITFLDDNNNVIAVIEPAGTQIPRLAEERQVVGHLAIGTAVVPVVQKTFVPEVDLPPEQKGVFYIVSGLIAQALAGKRNDLFVPDQLVRDEKGNIVGARALARVS